MAGSVNKVILVGNLGRDPEVRRLNSGEPVVNLRIATSETWKDKGSGERKEKTEWHSVVIFNENLARVAEQYLKKGSKVYVEGQLQTRKWTDQQGQEKYSTEVVLQRFRGELTILDSRGGGSAEFGDEEPGQVRSGGEFGRSAPPDRRPAPAQTSGGGGGGGSRYSDLDDDIPF
jgi:single-strand DNA-binding protein